MAFDAVTDMELNASRMLRGKAWRHHFYDDYERPNTSTLDDCPLCKSAFSVWTVLTRGNLKMRCDVCGEWVR